MTSIHDLLSDLGVEYLEDGHEHARHGWVQMDCCYCSPGWKHWRLGYNLAYGYLNCWACGPQRLDETLSEITGLPRTEIRNRTRGLVRETLPDREVTPGKLIIPRGVGELLTPHRRFLERRGFDPDKVAAEWGVKGFGPDAVPKYQWRLYIPVVRDFEQVSWTTRAIGKDHGLRYRSAELTQEKVPHKSVVYGADLAGHAVCVCEGPLDAWAVGVGGVATFGTDYTRAQLLRLTRFPVRVVCLDSTPEGERAADRLVRELSSFPGDTYKVTLTTGKDPSRASRKELRELRRMLA